jgi:linoleoyl-CoA desaturase
MAPTPDDGAPRVRFAERSAFSVELQGRADAYFASTGLTPRDTPRMYLKSALILCWFGGSWAVLVFASRAWWTALPLAVSLGLSIAAIGMSVMHDANHGGYSRSPAVNRFFGSTLDLMGVNSFIWRHKHNALHHTYTNVEGVDYDVDFGVLARLTPGQARRPWQRYQHLYLWLFYGFLLPKWVFYDDLLIWRSRRIGVHAMPRPSRTESILFVVWKLVFLAWAVVIPALFHPLLVVAAFHTIAAFTLGLTLGTTFQLAHCLGDADFPSAPRPPGRMATDWSAHQLDTTVDFAAGNPLVTWLCGGLNFQVEHHLFPKVCHIHYPALARIVDEVSLRHGLRRRFNVTWRDAVSSHFRHLRKLGAPSPLAASPG